MIFICTYFQKMDIVSFSYLQTCFLHHFIDILIKYHTPIFCWTHNVIYQHIHIVRFVNIYAHALNISHAQQAAGN